MSSVQVKIRLKPSVKATEIKVNGNTISIPNPRNTGEKIIYTFDTCFDQDASQQDIWESNKSVIDQATAGKNVTIFAYGQTSSGKTFTMSSLIQRTVRHLLTFKSLVTSSFIEIYNEKIFDLLAQDRNLSGLDLRQNGKEIVVSGVTVVNITDMVEFSKQYDIALRNRSTASTNLNQESSRSHFILQLSVKTSIGDDKYLTSKVHLIDLAGSEDNKRTGNSGARMDESCAINKSLFVLGQVVEALNGKAARIPYRDSKITRILQDCLGGNSLSVIIACLSADEKDSMDTYNTLNFATKASLIKNTITVNETVISKPVVDETANRLKALQEWKKNQPQSSNQSKKPYRLSTESATSNDGSNVKRFEKAGSPLSNVVVDQLKKDLTAQLKKDFERQVNESVEAKLRLITDGLLRQKIASERFELMQKKLDNKISSFQESGKENLTNNLNGRDIDSLKAITKCKILHILNRGSIKSLMTLKTIGKKRAETIYNDREINGEFKELDDLIRAGFKQSQITTLFQSNIDLSG